MLLQEPGVSEHLVALIAPQARSVLLPVLHTLRPGLGGEGATLLLARITSVHLLMSLQLAGEGEPHLATLISALVRGQLGVLLTHMRLQLLVLLKLKTTTVNFTHIHLVLLLIGVDSADVSGPVGVGGEGLSAAVHGASKRLQPVVSEVVSGQVIEAAEGLAAAVVLTCVRLHSGVFTQVSI